MLAALGIGSILLAINMSIQVAALIIVIRIYVRKMESGTAKQRIPTEVTALGILLGIVYLGHLLQFASWALLFVWLGEFTDFETAFYHSSVNFTSLGYGDIVMSPKWRLLGGLEAANGVLMFGLSAGAVLSVMSHLFSRYTDEFRAHLRR